MYVFEHKEHDEGHTPEWARDIIEQIDSVKKLFVELIEPFRKEIRKMTDDQAHLDADVQALTAGLSNVEAEIAALKNQPAAASLDFTALDAAVTRLQGDAPAAPAV